MNVLIEILKVQIRKLTARFLLLEKRTRVLILVLIAAFIFSSILNLIYKPQKLKIRQLGQELTVLKSKNQTLRAQIPDVASEKQMLEQEKASLKSLESELSKEESQLPQLSNLSELLRTLVEPQDDLKIEFNTIKPVDTEKKERYDRLNIEMNFSTDYLSLVNYIHHLEETFKFLSTTDINVKQSEKKEGYPLEVTMILSSFLSQEEGERASGQLKAVKTEPIKSLQRDPYLSSSRSVTSVASPQERMGLRLSGIVSREKTPTAIINAEVVKVGDVVEGHKVIEINKDGVVLQDGKGTLFLPIQEPAKE